MGTWIDPKEDAASLWGGRKSSSEQLEPMAGTVARAIETTLPFQYSETAQYRGTLPDTELDGVQYTSAQVTINGIIQSDRHIKLLSRGYLWTADDGASYGRRFKFQLRRPGPPSETTPFGSYVAWNRYQTGTVETTESEDVAFEPTPDTTRTERGNASFEEVPRPLRQHVAELELVRNPAFAEYVLRERDQWDDYGGVFRWIPTAFDQRFHE
ncbi:hypothetical protein [Halorussus pelagicus]|uniref:hypothetical protein n=1 Tax=Halorussus pelagicus TaxID=2505977 RepID=UPI000FFB9189|nr:hypothetical protein [Halorussus pelagicus]